MKFTVLFDFDGVLHAYSTPVSAYPGGVWDDAHIPDGAVKAGMETLYGCILSGKIDPVIYSSRSKTAAGREAMAAWLVREHARYVAELGPGRSTLLEEMKILERVSFEAEKPAAWLTIDDRAWCFTGNRLTAQEILDFKPWNKGGQSAVMRAVARAASLELENDEQQLEIERHKLEVARLQGRLRRETEAHESTAEARALLIQQLKAIKAAKGPEDPARTPFLREVIIVQREEIAELRGLLGVDARLKASRAEEMLELHYPDMPKTMLTEQLRQMEEKDGPAETEGGAAGPRLSGGAGPGAESAGA